MKQEQYRLPNRQNVDTKVKIFYPTKFVIGISDFLPLRRSKESLWSLHIIAPYGQGARMVAHAGLLVFHISVIQNIQSSRRLFRFPTACFPQCAKAGAKSTTYDFSARRIVFCHAPEQHESLRKAINQYKYFVEKIVTICLCINSEAETPVFNRCVIDFAPVESTKFAK